MNYPVTCKHCAQNIFGFIKYCPFCGSAIIEIKAIIEEKESFIDNKILTDNINDKSVVEIYEDIESHDGEEIIDIESLVDNDSQRTVLISEKIPELRVDSFVVNERNEKKVDNRSANNGVTYRRIIILSLSLIFIIFGTYIYNKILSAPNYEVSNKQNEVEIEKLKADSVKVEAEKAIQQNEKNTVDRVQTTRSIDNIVYNNVIPSGSRIEIWALENGIETRKLSVQAWTQINGILHVTLAEDIPIDLRVNAKIFPLITQNNIRRRDRNDSPPQDRMYENARRNEGFEKSPPQVREDTYIRRNRLINDLQ